MDDDIKQQILFIIAQANYAYTNALLPENEGDMGYPYFAGYSRSALNQIRELMEKGQ